MRLEELDSLQVWGWRVRPVEHLSPPCHHSKIRANISSPLASYNTTNGGHFGHIKLHPGMNKIFFMFDSRKWLLSKPYGHRLLHTLAVVHPIPQFAFSPPSSQTDSDHSPECPNSYLLYISGIGQFLNYLQSFIVVVFILGGYGHGCFPVKYVISSAR